MGKWTKPDLSNLANYIFNNSIISIDSWSISSTRSCTKKKKEKFFLQYIGTFIGFGLVCWSLTSLCHSNGHIETMPAREINPFTALTRIRSQFLRTQWSTSNHQRVHTTTPQTAQPSGLGGTFIGKLHPKQEEKMRKAIFEKLTF